MDRFGKEFEYRIGANAGGGSNDSGLAAGAAGFGGKNEDRKLFELGPMVEQPVKQIATTARPSQLRAGREVDLMHSPDRNLEPTTLQPYDGTISRVNISTKLQR